MRERRAEKIPLCYLGKLLLHQPNRYVFQRALREHLPSNKYIAHVFRQLKIFMHSNFSPSLSLCVSTSVDFRLSNETERENGIENEKVGEYLPDNVALSGCKMLNLGKLSSNQHSSRIHCTTFATNKFS